MMVKSRGFERLGERKIHRFGQGGERIARHGAQLVLDAVQVFDQIFAAAKSKSTAAKIDSIRARAAASTINPLGFVLAGKRRNGLASVIRASA